MQTARIFIVRTKTRTTTAGASMSNRDIPPFREGQRVEFEVSLERSPHFTIPAGSTGVVDYVDESLLTVQMDARIPGLEKWDNQVDFPPEDFPQAMGILRVLGDP
jgi:hypothetical protein